MAVKSPLKYHGGKSRLAKKQVGYEPRTYKLFGDCCVGGGSYLTVKDRPGVAEFANDLDGNLLNFFRVLQQPESYKRFMSLLENTPFSDQEFAKASSMLETTGDTQLIPCPSLAWAFFVVNRQSRQGLGKDFATRTRRTRRDRNENTSAWLSAVDQVVDFRDRLKWVEMRQMDVCDFIAMLDSPDAFFYVDPPYTHDTRTAGRYAVEMEDAQHFKLLTLLSNIEGKFMLCGYPSKLYETFEQASGWNRIEFQVAKSSSSASTKPVAVEAIWRNYKD